MIFLIIKYTKPGATWNKRRQKTSEYRCVAWSKQKDKWEACLTCRNKRYFVGHFDKEIDAAIATNIKCQILGIALKNPQVAKLQISVKFLHDFLPVELNFKVRFLSFFLNFV